MLRRKSSPSAPAPTPFQRELSEWLIRQARLLQQIPAPTFAEANRAAWVVTRFHELGLIQIDTDAMHNVFGLYPSPQRDGPALLVTAHLDTIFDAGTDLIQREDGDLVYGPGLGDNTIGVAALLALARWLGAQPPPPVPVWFVATTREEGLGDLGGMKAAFARLRDQAGAVLNIEGMALGHVYYGGIAVRRLKVSAATGGGHSWLHYGQPSAVHTLMQLGARLLELQPPSIPRSTFNIGLIEGGDAVNAIASHAAFWLDLRSESSAALAQFEQQVRAVIASHPTTGDVRLSVEVVGDRPAGQLALDHPLVQIGVAALASVGIRATLETGSTDANVPLAAGCPAITLGVTRGGNVHRTDEYIELSPVPAGFAHLTQALNDALRYVAQTGKPL